MANTTAKKDKKEPSRAEQRKELLKLISDTYNGDDTISLLFRKAVDLEGEKRALLDKIAANRRSLRDMAAQDLASQSDVDALYPPKAASDENGDEPAAS